MKRLLLILGTLVLFSGTASATDYFVGDSGTITDCYTGLALSYEYVRGTYPLPGTDSLQLDSVWVNWRRTASGTYADTLWVGIRKTTTNTAPGNASLIVQASDTVSDNTCALRKVIIFPGASRLKGGDVIAFSVGNASADTAASQIGITTTSVYGCYKNTPPDRVTGFPANFSCLNTWATAYAFSIGVWCHSATGGGPGGGTGLRVIIQKH